MRLVIVESPFAGKDSEELDRNLRYARAALTDCLRRGEAPFASHLLYAQPGVLRDEVGEERYKGIEAGLAWGKVAEATVVYSDLGISSGMRKGMLRATEEKRPIEMRTIQNRCSRCGEAHASVADWQYTMCTRCADEAKS